MYNDHYGHLGGDACLKMVAKAMATCVRTDDLMAGSAASDLVARYGGEEFGVVLPETDVDSAYTVAERIRAEVAALAEPQVTATHGVVTVSIGVAALVPAPGSRPEVLVEAADAALYQAKRTGRNRVTTPLTAATVTTRRSCRCHGRGGGPSGQGPEISRLLRWPSRGRTPVVS